MGSPDTRRRFRDTGAAVARGLWGAYSFPRLHEGTGERVQWAPHVARAYASSMRAAFAVAALAILTACSSTSSQGPAVVEDASARSAALPCDPGAACTCANGANGQVTCAEGQRGACIACGRPELGDAGADVAADAPAPCSAPAIWYRDEDDDGYGAANTAPRSICDDDTRGYAQNALDCDDSDDRAHPGQTQPQSTPRRGPATPSFDFDCDGVETRTRTGTATCSGCELVNRSGTGGWQAEPACGVEGQIVTGCRSVGPGTCSPAYTPAVQTCL